MKLADIVFRFGCLGSAPNRKDWRGFAGIGRKIGGTLSAVILAFPAQAGEAEDCRVIVTPVAESKPVPKIKPIPKAGTVLPKPKRKWAPKTRVYHTVEKDEWEIVCDEPALPPGPMEVLAGPIEPGEFTPVPLLEPPSPTKPEPPPCDCFAPPEGWGPPWTYPPLLVVGPPHALPPPIPAVHATPVPEPETWLMLAAGLGFVIWRKR